MTTDPAAASSGYFPPFDEDRMSDAVRRLTESILVDPRTRYLAPAYLPDRRVVLEVLERLEWIVFPGFFGPRELSADAMHGHVVGVVDQVARPLFEQISGALRYQQAIEHHDEPFDEHSAECDARAREVVTHFFEKLPLVRRWRSLDVQAAFDGDPAARHPDETIFCYPGVHALMVHRLAHELYRLDVPLVPRIMHEHAHARTGIDIHPGARIAPSFFIDHGTGVVIGETTIIGEHCKIYQGVTLGAKSFPKDATGRLERGTKRHPTLEDHVTAYAGATILGGDTIIGAGSVVNGGVFLTHSVPPGHVVRGPRVDITLRNNPELPPASYTI